MLKKHIQDINVQFLKTLTIIPEWSSSVDFILICKNAHPTHSFLFLFEYYLQRKK